jgi:hypothetical protein
MLFKTDPRRRRAFMDVTIDNNRRNVHANLLMLWKPFEDHRIHAVLFEPHGSTEATDTERSLDPLFILTGVVLIETQYIGVQRIDGMVRHLQRKDEEGYCALWCIVVAELFIRFPGVSPLTVLQMLWVHLANPRDALTFIRKYVVYVRKMLRDRSQIRLVRDIMSLNLHAPRNSLKTQTS